MTANHRRILLAFGFLLFLTASETTSCFGQVVTVPQILEQQKSWKKFADEGKKLQIEGRFQSRVTDAFRMERIDVTFRHPSTIRLPDRIHKGQRIEVVGTFVSDGPRITFSVTRMQVRDTDEEQLRKRASEPEWALPDKQLELAAQFVPRAEFYEDDVLRQEIAALRTRALTAKKKLIAGNATALRELLAQGEKLNVSESLRQELRFEQALAEVRLPDFNPDQLQTLVHTLPGWDGRVMQIPEPLKAAFDRDPVAAYAHALDTERKYLHRLLYIRVRLETLNRSLKPDGSNAGALARIIRDELPSEVKIAAEFERREIQWHLSRTAGMDRQELIQVTELFAGLQRRSESEQLRSQWLQEQEKRFGTNSLAGLLRTADEYLFVAEQWQDQSSRERGVQLLKEAWERAGRESPEDVAAIAERLKTLGWEYFRGGWLTADQITMLPKDDVQLAIREGRVVRGMTAEQVTKTLGKPRSVSRLGNSRVLREFWNYDEAGLVIRLRRNLQRPEEGMTVDDVARTR